MGFTELIISQTERFALPKYVCKIRMTLLWLYSKLQLKRVALAKNKTRGCYWGSTRIVGIYRIYTPERSNISGDVFDVALLFVGSRRFVMRMWIKTRWHSRYFVIIFAFPVYAGGSAEKCFFRPPQQLLQGNIFTLHQEIPAYN